MYFQHLDPPSILFVKYLINITFRACLKISLSILNALLDDIKVVSFDSTLHVKYD